MGPKGIGPQKLGAGQASPAKNVNKGYGHDLKSPAKIAGVLASALVGKAVDKLAK
tara:strand:- start:586 stop:750 length:165 start_codon:yes stop_codon:yes gene_type:complete